MDFLRFTKQSFENLEFRFLGSGLHSSDWGFSSETFMSSFFHNFSTKMVEF